MKNNLLRLLSLVLCFCMLFSFAACGEDAPAKDDDITPPANDTPTADEPSADEPAVDEPTTDEPTTDEPTTDEPTTDEPTADEPTADEPNTFIDESNLTEEYLISLVALPENHLNGNNAPLYHKFVFDEDSPLSGETLVKAFILFTPYDELIKHQRSDGLYYFTQEVIYSELRKWFKHYEFDITLVYHYNTEENAVVMNNVSGFGGDLPITLTDYKVNGNLLYISISVFNNGVYTNKEYLLEFYDGGYFYIYAKQIS